MSDHPTMLRELERKILWYALAFGVQGTKSALTFGVTLFGSESVPFRRLGVVRIDTSGPHWANGIDFTPTPVAPTRQSCLTSAPMGHPCLVLIPRSIPNVHETKRPGQLLAAVGLVALAMGE